MITNFDPNENEETKEVAGEESASENTQEEGASSDGEAQSAE